MAKPKGDKGKQLPAVKSSDEKALSPVQSKEINGYLESLGSTLSEYHKTQFIGVCRELQLNPIRREIYGVPYTDKNGKVTFSIIVGYEVYLKRAEKSGLLKHWKVWTDGTPGTAQMKACIEIKRRDWEESFYHEVFYSEYVVKVKHQNGNWYPNAFWRKPITQLKKVAMSQGFRLCFTEACGGIPYIEEELYHGVEFGNGDSQEQDDGKIDPDSPFRQPVEAEAEVVEEPLPEVVDETPPKTEERQPGEDREEDAAQPQNSKAEAASTHQERAKAAVEMREILKERFKDASTDIDAFLVAKKWLQEGEGFPSLTDTQIKRLYANYDSLKSLFDKWVSEKTV